MRHEDLFEEADECRRRALAYVGKPEAPFLLRIADEFEKLASDQQNDRRKRTAAR